MPEFRGLGDTAREAAGSQPLSHAMVGTRVDDPNTVGLFEQQLSEHGASDDTAETRHYTSTPSGGGGPVLIHPMNYHFTPQDSRVALMRVTNGDPRHELEMASYKAVPLLREDVRPDLAAEVYAPDQGMVTPQKRHLTETAEDRVLEHYVEGGATPPTIAHIQRLDLGQVNHVLEQHARQEAAAGQAPVRRAATPEALKPRDDEPGRLTLRALRHEVQEGGPGSSADQLYKGMIATGTGGARRMTHVGQRDIGDQALDGDSGNAISKLTGFNHRNVNRFLQQHELSGPALRDRFTQTQREAVAMRYLFGNRSLTDIARAGHAGPSFDATNISKWVTQFNKRYPEGSSERAAKQAAFQGQQAASGSGAAAGL